MRFFGLDITRASATPEVDKGYSPVDGRGGWWPVIRESFTGAWQRNIDVKFDAVLSFHADFACRTLIASDIAKLRVKLVQDSGDGIWTEVSNPAYSPVLRKPNTFQNRIQFFEGWVLSKLQWGNTYVLKERDGRNIVVRLYVLSPDRCRPVVLNDGSVYYQLSTDNISGLTKDVLVPASEIIHDRFNCMFHPLVGISPIYANGLSATQGLNIQNQSARFFANDSQPGGILTAPGEINEPTALRLKALWEENYSGNNRGRVAVLGDGLKYEKMALTAVEGQLIEQLKWTAEVVCSTYHVPPYKIGVGQMPPYTNVQALNIEYYSQCLQRLIEDLEICLDEGLAVGEKIGTQFDTDNLLRMDSVAQADVVTKLAGGGIMKIDEARRRFDLPHVAGGDTPYLQQQNYSLAALAKRDAQPDPFAPKTAAPTSASNPGQADDAAMAKALIAAASLRKLLMPVSASLH